MTLLQSVLLKSSKTQGNLPVCNPSCGQDLRDLAAHISSSCWAGSTLPDCARSSQVQRLASQACCAAQAAPSMWQLRIVESENIRSWKGPTSKLNSCPCTGQSQESYLIGFWFFSSVPKITPWVIFFFFPAILYPLNYQSGTWSPQRGRHHSAKDSLMPHVTALFLPLSLPSHDVMCWNGCRKHNREGGFVNPSGCPATLQLRVSSLCS